MEFRIIVSIYVYICMYSIIACKGIRWVVKTDENDLCEMLEEELKVMQCRDVKILCCCC